MAEHIYEEQQVEALKRWWRENGRSVTFGLVLGIALLIGWNLYQNYTEQRQRQASLLYTELLNLSTPQEAIPVAEQLISQFGDLPIYATFGRYFLARFKSELNQIEEAVSALEAAYREAPGNAYRHIARLREARLLIDRGEPQKALTLLQTPELPRAFAGLYAEVRGDAEMALGEREKAKAAYEEAWRLGLRHPFLRLKLEEMGSPLPGGKENGPKLDHLPSYPEPKLPGRKRANQ